MHPTCQAWLILPVKCLDWRECCKLRYFFEINGWIILTTNTNLSQFVHRRFTNNTTATTFNPALKAHGCSNTFSAVVNLPFTASSQCFMHCWISWLMVLESCLTHCRRVDACGRRHISVTISSLAAEFCAACHWQILSYSQLFSCTSAYWHSITQRDRYAHIRSVPSILSLAACSGNKFIPTEFREL